MSDKLTPEEQKEINDFALKLSKTMKELGSSHVYFIMQQAFENDTGFKEFGMSWEDCVEKWEAVIERVERIN